MSVIVKNKKTGEQAVIGDSDWAGDFSKSGEWDLVQQVTGKPSTYQAQAPNANPAIFGKYDAQGNAVDQGGPLRRVTGPPLQYNGNGPLPMNLGTNVSVPPGGDPYRTPYGNDNRIYPVDETVPATTLADQAGSYYKHPNSPAQFNLPVLMKDGTTRTFSAIDSNLDAALKDGGRPVDIYGQPMTVTTDVYGGYMVTDSKGAPMPLNVAGGGDWLPGQKEALGNYVNAGWKPGSPALPPAQTPALGPEAAQYYPPGATGGGSPFDFGYLTQPFNDKFKGPAQQQPFQPTTAENVRQDPGYQFTLDEAQKALERRASSAAYLGTPRALKEMTRFTEDYAGNQFGNADVRRKQDYAIGAGQNTEAYSRAAAEFDRNRDIYRTNRSDIYNYIAPLASVGQVAAGATGRYGSDYAGNVGNILMNTGETNANARIASGNAWQAGVNNAINNVVDVYGRRRYGLSQVAGG